jgi:hypothetical protein
VLAYESAPGPVSVYAENGRVKKGRNLVEQGRGGLAFLSAFCPRAILLTDASNCPDHCRASRAAMPVRLSYHAEQSFHKENAKYRRPADYFDPSPEGCAGEICDGSCDWLACSRRGSKGARAKQQESQRDSRELSVILSGPRGRGIYFCAEIFRWKIYAQISFRGRPRAGFAAVL